MSYFCLVFSSPLLKTLFKFECDQLFLSQVHENGKCRYNYHNKENKKKKKMDLN